MSAHRRRLTVRPEAQVDIDDILLSTRERWGVEQHRRYSGRLKQAMRSLIDYTELGQSWDDLYRGCRGLVVERHVIVYPVTESEIDVCRVLYQKRDPTGKVRP